MFASRLLSSSRILNGVSPLLRNSTRLFSTVSPLSPMAALRQTQVSSSLISPTQSTTNSPILSSLASLQSGSIFSNLLGGQRRWKSRGNNYQPNTYKRKKTLGFMSRMRSKTGRVIIARRKAKGRWYLAH